VMQSLDRAPSSARTTRPFPPASARSSTTMSSNAPSASTSKPCRP
jgi:hypothetical protein